MITVQILKKDNRRAIIQLDSYDNYKVTKIINTDQVTGSKTYTTLKGAIKFGNTHING